MQEWLLDGAPTGCQAAHTDNGWIKRETFLQWLQFVVEQVCPTATRKVLVLDNHKSHMYIKALDFVMANNVLFLSFAPHTAHGMQRLDVPAYGPLKLYSKQEICTFKK
jgi:hypothetical protein